DIRIDGVRTADDPRGVHLRLGYLSDTFGLYNALTVRQCLLHQAAMHGMDNAAQTAAADAAIERMKLGDLAKKRAGALSRGQRQRLAIGQAIVHGPKVLLLDEPASGLDPEARWRLSSMLTDMARDGMTLIVSSHILSELEDYCTHVLALRGGKVILDAPVSAAVRELGAQAGEDGAPAMACIRIQLAAGSDFDLEKAL
ncbi:MAG: ABC transporter ATP-binding protein, partial [Phycisphaerales bacterium]|nr:ABC transporter ATP-binding protein [Phycisphaerales bacterium]